MRAVGIDLGTTNSAAAIGGKDPKVLPNRSGEQLTPSAVSFVTKKKAEQGEIVVGRLALGNAVRDPTNTILSIKRLMGRLYGEKWEVYGGLIDVDVVRQHVSFRIAEAPKADQPNQEVKVHLADKTYSPTEISAMILRQVKADAEQSLGETVTHAVITVPAYFSERQRFATQKAGELAGLKVLRILDEPTAAALAFGAGREGEEHRVLVYDLGGGTFDISIIAMKAGQYVCLGLEGNNWLGGDDFDQTIVRRILRYVQETYQADLSQDKAFLARAKEEAEKAKKALSAQQSVDIFAPVLKHAVLGTVDIELTITREEFVSDIGPMIEETIALVHKALGRLKLKPEKISEVLLVGGSTAIPAVQDAVAAVFGREKVKRHVNPMECVALGAALMASSYDLQDSADSAKEVSTVAGGPRVTQTTHLDLGIAAVEGDNTDVFAVIIPKSTPYPLPKPMKRQFIPSADNQKKIRVPVYEGLNRVASLNEKQGEIEFELPDGIPASTPVEVSFNYDTNRVLTVEIRVVGRENLFVKQTLQHGRGVAKSTKGQTLMDDWREELGPSVRMGQYFLQNYGAFMDDMARGELEEAIAKGEHVLARGNQEECRQATNLLRNSLVSGGTASVLFLAERVMQTPIGPERQREIGERVGKLRLAHKQGNAAEVTEHSRHLRAKIAQTINEQNAGKAKDPALDDLLRIVSTQAAS